MTILFNINSNSTVLKLTKTILIYFLNICCISLSLQYGMIDFDMTKKILNIKKQEQGLLEH